MNCAERSGRGVYPLPRLGTRGVLSGPCIELGESRKQRINSSLSSRGQGIRYVSLKQLRSRLAVRGGPGIYPHKSGCGMCVELARSNHALF
jgi:hypothetical protein